MKLLIVLILVLSVSVFADIFEYGFHGGLYLPTGDIGDVYNASPIFGGHILYHLPMIALEGSISYAVLQDAAELEDFSASIIPVLGGIRSYSGTFFYGGGLALHTFSVDDSETELGCYGNAGIVIPLTGMDFELSAKYHALDFEFDDPWISLTAGLNF